MRSLRCDALAVFMASLVPSLLVPCATAAQEKTAKPRLSEAIQAALSQGGPEAAQHRFDEIFPKRKNGYEIDVNRLMELGADYTRRGDMMWGDVAPWVLRSEAETIFVQAQLSPGEVEIGATPIHLEFQLGRDGKARSLAHNIGWESRNPLTRVGDLPADWECVSRSR